MFDYPFPRRAWERGKTLTPSSSLLISNEYLYTGRRLDPETGLQLNRNRFYASHLERWVNRDLIGYEGSKWNLYEYVNGMPTTEADPNGFAPPGSHPGGWGPQDLTLHLPIQNILGTRHQNRSQGQMMVRDSSPLVVSVIIIATLANGETVLPLTLHGCTVLMNVET